MDHLQKLEETMKVLDLLSTFLTEGSENFVICDEVRDHIEDAFVKIRDIYEALGDDPMLEKLN